MSFCSLNSLNQLTIRRPLILSFMAAVYLYPLGASAKTITASQGTTASIQAAISSAASGDTVMIPAGTFSYSGSISLNAGITIVGAGPTSTILEKSGSSTAPLFQINGSNGQRITISNFALKGVVSSSSSLHDVGIRLNNCKDFYVHDMNFSNFGDACIYVKGNCRGLVSKCRFVDVYRPAIGSLGYGVVVYGDGSSSWSRSLDLGGEDAIYVEDSYFKNNRHAIASNEGARYVFRYNTVLDNASNFQPIDAHGREYGSSRGTRSYEIYNNTIDNSVRTSICQVFIRGGDGVIFDNTFLRGVTKKHILLANRTDGSASSTSYPAPDQTRSLYAWNNKTADGATVGVSVQSGHENFFKLDRDFFNEKMQGYTPYKYPHPLATEVSSYPVAIASKGSLTINSTAEALKTGIVDYIPGKEIRYSMAEAATARLSINDMNGRTIAVIFNQKQSAGIHTINLERTTGQNRIAAGQYVYRLAIGNQMFTVTNRK